MRQMTVTGFTELLMRVRARLPEAERVGLEHGAQIIEQEAKDLIGTEYAGWAPLADSTVARKSAKGQTGRVSATDPLYATGELRATISHYVEGETAVIGTPDQVGVYMELGTSRVPPRPFLSSAAYRKHEEAANAIGASAAYLLAGKSRPRTP